MYFCCYFFLFFICSFWQFLFWVSLFGRFSSIWWVIIYIHYVDISYCTNWEEPPHVSLCCCTFLHSNCVFSFIFFSGLSPTNDSKSISSWSVAPLSGCIIGLGGHCRLLGVVTMLNFCSLKLWKIKIDPIVTKFPFSYFSGGVHSMNFTFLPDILTGLIIHNTQPVSRLCCIRLIKWITIN